MLEIQSSKLVLTLVDTETGEVFTKEATFGDFKEATKKATTTRTKKVKDDGSDEPHATLFEGKIQLNEAAMNLTGFEADMKIDIRFEKKGRVITPIMLEDPSKGNRLTKSNTISCRGSKNDNLLEYGDVFVVVPYEGKNNVFKLIGNKEQPEDDIIDVPEEITDPEDDSIDVDEFDDIF
jgi:hypothetical protein